jgi:RND family efflux transporter MFP subunit
MRYLVILLAAAFVGCRAGAGSCGGHNHETEGHNHAAEAFHGHEGHNHIVFTHEQAEAAGLEVEAVEPTEFRQVIKAGGQVLSTTGGEAAVVATSSGIVSLTRALAEGAAVVKGQAIATISARGLAEGDAAVRARAELEAAERDYLRAELLADDQIISQKELDEARRRYESARSATPSGVAAAPMTGYIKNILVGEGEYVATGQPIATVAQDATLRLRADLPERWFGDLPAITGANFKLPYDDTVYHADKLLSYGKAAEGSYVPVTFEFANTSGALAGAYAEVWLLGAPRQNVLSIPKTALTEAQGLYFVYLQHGAGNYARQEVALGADNGERVEVTKGLKAGDIVVSRGVTQVRLAATSSAIPAGHTH